MPQRTSRWFALVLALASLGGCGDDSMTATVTTDAMVTTDATSTTDATNTMGATLTTTGGTAEGTAGSTTAADGTSTATTTGTDGGPSTGSSSDGGATEPDGVQCLGAPQDCVVGEICCGGVKATLCQDPATPCSGDALACDGAEDCPGAACCSTPEGTACVDTCDGFRICNGDSDCDAGESCCPNGGGVPLGALDHCTTLGAGETCPLPP